MTINTENPSRMVLQDKKQSAFLITGALALIGLVVVLTSVVGRHGVFPIFFGSAFAGIAAFILFRIRMVTIELDKAAGTIHILLQGIKSKQERNLGMAQIQKLLLRKLIRTHTTRSSTPIGGNFQNRTTTSSTTTWHQFILVFVTDQNEEIPFDFGKVKIGLMNMITSPEEKIRRNAQEVANFLGVPLDAATPSASDVLGAIRDGIAGRFQKAH